MGKMTFDSLLSELRNMRREQQKGLAWDAVGIAFWSAFSLSFAVISCKAFKWAVGENVMALERGALLIGALACAWQSVRFIKLLVESCEYEAFAIHRQNLRKIAKAEKRFKIYKRAFEIKKERHGKD